MSLNFICDTAIFQGVCLAPATQVSRTAKPIFMGGELFPHANYTLEMINDMIQEIEICPDGDIPPKNLDARYKLPRMDYFKIFFKKNGYRKDIAVAKELLKLYVKSPWHVVDRAQNVQTSGDLLVLAKNLSFHKNLPTLDQISTIPDDLSKYTQVADASGKVQATQDMGKPWHIDRNPKFPRANCLALRAFKISALAAEIHLDEDDAMGKNGWLRDEKSKPLPKGTKIEAGKIYTIPNTVYIDYGKGLDSLALILYKIAGYVVKMKLKDETNYKIVYTNSVSAKTIISHLKSFDIYKYLYVGHGGEGFPGSLSPEPGSRRSNTIIHGARYTQYKIPQIALIACSSLKKYLGKIGWMENISKGGAIMGFDKDISAIKGLYDLIIIKKEMK